MTLLFSKIILEVAKQSVCMSQNFNTRQTLLLKLKDQRDDKAWNDFHETYHRYIRAILWNMNLSEEDANDILQTVMLKIWNKLPEFDYAKSKGKFRNWISVITANTARNHIRTENRLYNCLNGEKSKWLDDYTNPVLPPEIEEISAKEWEKFVSTMAWENVSNGLSDNVKEAFERLMKGEKVRDIAQSLDVNENTIIVYKNRIKNKMYMEIVRLQNELG